MKIHHFKEVTSTNEVARQYLEDGAVIVADTQVKGRGRYARPWHSPEGGLWASLVIQHPPAPILNLAAALSIAKTFEYFGLSTQVKWPNDVHIDQRKISGTLSETEGDFMIIGVGVNLNNTAFPEDIPGTSYVTETGKEIDIMQFLEKFVETFNSTREKEFLHEYQKYSSTIGRRVLVKNGVDLIGTAVGVDAQGRLILRLEDGREIKVYSGDVFRLYQLE